MVLCALKLKTIVIRACFQATSRLMSHSCQFVYRQAQACSTADCLALYLLATVGCSRWQARQSRKSFNSAWMLSVMRCPSFQTSLGHPRGAHRLVKVPNRSLRRTFQVGCLSNSHIGSVCRFPSPARTTIKDGALFVLFVLWYQPIASLTSHK